MFAESSYPCGWIGRRFMQAIAVSMNVLEFAEPVLVALALFFFIRSGRTRQFPMMTTYLGLRVASAAMLEVVLHLQRFTPISETLQSSIYFYTYWAVYIAAAISIFFVIREVFRHVTEPVPGIQRFGMLAFNWVAVISGIIAISTALPLKGLGAGLVSIGFQVMRCVSILELCLLAFLALFIHSLGRSFRSLAFGIALGFGLQAAMELITALVASHSTYLDSNMNIVLQIAITLVLGGWIIYFVLPEPQREPEAITLPVSSPLIRWNEIANALGHSTPHVLVGQSSATFLQDVEQVVDKILTKSSISANR